MIHQKIRHKAFFGFIFFCLSIITHLSAENDEEFTEERMFHIARSKNKNLVCYEINLTGGKPDAKKPLNIYWLNREDKPGTTSPLNALQKRLAYGYKLVLQDGDSCKITLNAYPDRLLTIRKHGGKYTCFTTINNRAAILQSIYVQAKATNSLSVEYVELQGIIIDTQQPVTEKVRNTK